ncbi:hypothetical protein PUR61_36365 [Streptomyces sp. BE20]|uniref:hypothetical protein n=1 Tax=Streptomycetaceae TaxID=2062 RepID=UPI002E76ECF2|nr:MULTISPECIES: hypothetical protein [unclassified Streptomyces]MED7951533.1 hypothetical protein [Streptomyces sp. BE303]MEE1827614.1 hypothetical protein [Streptomyces sp. BE20]
MHETTTKRRNGCLIGCGVIGVLLLVLLALGGWLLYSNYRDGFIEGKEYDAVQVGTPEADVRRELPDGESFFTRILAEDLSRGEPAVPEGSGCLRLLSTESAERNDDVIVFRFCFRNGTLAEKTSYTVRG